jgi:hypothetical protein
MKVTWSDIPRQDQNGIIRGFKIVFFNVDFGSVLENMTVQPTVKEREYYNLSIYNTYGVQIRGFTIIGDGPANNLTEARTEESGKLMQNYFSGRALNQISKHLKTE